MIHAWGLARMLPPSYHACDRGFKSPPGHQFLPILFSHFFFSCPNVSFFKCIREFDLKYNELLPMTQAAYILLNVQPGMLEAVQEGLKKMKEVTEVYAVYGIYDLIVKIEYDTMDELKNQVLNQNIIVEGVKNSMTMICVN